MTESSSSGRGGRSGRSSDVDVHAVLTTLAQQVYALAGRVNPNDETVAQVKAAVGHVIEELGGEVPPEPTPAPASATEGSTEAVNPISGQPIPPAPTPETPAPEAEQAT